MNDPRNPGRLLAIWGGYGSPGRTTVAIALARTLGSKCGSALLIDADTYGADIGHVLSLSGAQRLPTLPIGAGAGNLARSSRHWRLRWPQVPMYSRGSHIPVSGGTWRARRFNLYLIRLRVLITAS